MSDLVDTLDGLPVGAVLLCADGKVREVVYGTSTADAPHPRLRGFNGGIEVIASRIAALLPATVLHRP